MISFAEAHEIELQFKISCKTNSGIEESFKQLAKVVHNLFQRSPELHIIRGTEFRPGGCIVLQARPTLSLAHETSGCRC